MSSSLVGSEATPRQLAREPGFLLLSLSSVAIGVAFAVALLKYHLAGGEGPVSGFVQRVIAGLYSGFGFVSALYLSLLLLLWGFVAFGTKTLGGPLRRIAASLVFCFSLSVLTAAMGGDGGTVGETIALRLTNAFGEVFVFLLLAVMTVAALLLATDWFFFRTFLRMSRRAFDGTRDQGVDLVEEDRLSVVTGGQLDREELARQRRRRLGLVPMPSDATGGTGGSTRTPRRVREQELMDRVLEEARRELRAGPPVPVTDPIPAPDREPPPTTPDLFAELDDDDVLQQAGEALERAWSDEAGKPTVLAPAPPSEEGPVETPEREVVDRETVDPDSARDVGRPADRGPAVELFQAAPDVAAGSELEDRADESDAPSEPAGEEAGEEFAAETADDEVDEPIAEPEYLLPPAPKMEIFAPPPQARVRVQESLFAEGGVPSRDLLDRAAKIVLTARRPMPSLLQRRLDLTFAEARQTLEYLEDLGVVAAPEGSGPWTALISLPEWEARR